MASEGKTGHNDKPTTRREAFTTEFFRSDPVAMYTAALRDYVVLSIFLESRVLNCEAGFPSDLSEEISEIPEISVVAK
ncbi:hypothetical protein KL924_001845 [Ogataea haglerorum]|nr:hypothetical protein KL924_001845 [Ogataea haglerorum]